MAQLFQMHRCLSEGYKLSYYLLTVGAGYFVSQTWNLQPKASVVELENLTFNEISFNQSPRAENAIIGDTQKPFIITLFLQTKHYNEIAN